MKLRRAALRGFALPLARPLATAHGSITRRAGLLVELEDVEGFVGYGEATPLPEFGTEDLARCRAELEAACRRGVTGDAPPEGLVAPALRATATPCAQTAFEAAWLELEAKRAGVTLARRLRERGVDCGAVTPGALAASVATQALVGGESVEAVEASAAAARDAGFRAFKLKLAVDSDARDVERVAALRRVVGEEATLRLDANEAWSIETAFAALEALAPFGIDFVEQPVARQDRAGLARLARGAAIPIAADEALQGAGLLECLDARATPILVVKPAALAGVGTALALAARARAEGLRVVWSTLLDGAVGRALPLALAAALSEPVSGSTGDEIHGLGTARLLAGDLGAEAGALDAGRLALLSGPGLGFAPRIDDAIGAVGAPPFEVVA